MKFVKNMFGRESKSKRKGITPVIAIVLLLMMTVAAAGMAYVWIMSLQEDIGEETRRDLDNLNMQKSARLAVSAVWNNGGNIDLIIKNAGTYVYTAADCTKIEVLVGSSMMASGSCAGLTSQGSTCTIASAVAFPTTAGELGAVTIKVIAPIGTGDTYRCSVPTDGTHHTSC